MELRVLREGSKTRIKLGSCCPTWYTYAEWDRAEGTAFLRRIPTEQKQGEQKHIRQ